MLMVTHLLSKREKRIVVLQPLHKSLKMSMKTWETLALLDVWTKCCLTTTDIVKVKAFFQEQVLIVLTVLELQQLALREKLPLKKMRVTWALVMCNKSLEHMDHASFLRS